MQIERIAIAPVKGLGLNFPEAVEVTETGVVGDRRYAMVDDKGLMANGKRFGTLIQVSASCTDDPETLVLTLPDGTQVGGAVELGETVEATFFGKPRMGQLVLGDYAEALSALAGQSLRLLRFPDGAAIDRPGPGSVSLQSMESLQALGREAGVGEAVDGRRFRMTFTVSGATEHAEDSWIGRRVRVGGAVIEPTGNIGRCVVTTHNPDVGETDLETLKVLAHYRGEIPTTEPIPFGVQARVVSPGRVAVGDDVTVEN